MDSGDRQFVRYVGDPDFHDGRVLDVHQSGDTVRVRIRGASGKVFSTEFVAAQVAKSNRPEGMLLYAISELGSDGPLRRFVFANWDEEDDAALEIEASGFMVYPGE